MSTRTSYEHVNLGPHLTTEQVWRALAKASFAVLGHVTPSGDPRSSGVVYKTVGRRLYVAVAPDGWNPKPSVSTGRRSCTRPARRRFARC